MKGLSGRIFTFAVILCFTVSMFAAVSVNAQEVSTENLEAYWKFDEGNGTTVADQSGKGRNLTVAGNSKWAEGKTGKAFDFDGSTVLLMDGKKQIKAYNLTISMYIKINEFPKSDTGANILVANEGISALGQGSVDFGFFGNQMYSYVTGIQWDKGDRVSGQTDFSSMMGSWHHVAVVYNQDFSEEMGKSFLFIDGKLEGSADLSLTVGGDILMGFPKTASYPKYNACIGGYRDDSGNVIRSVTGAVDEMMIFSRALTDSEIAQLAGSKSEPAPTEDSSSTTDTGTTADTAQDSTSDSTSDNADTSTEGTTENTDSNSTDAQTTQQNASENSMATTTENTAVEGTANESTTTAQQDTNVNSNNTEDTGKAVETVTSEVVKSSINFPVVIPIIALLVVIAGGTVFVVLRRKRRV